jgi:hypothetical protein
VLVLTGPECGDLRYPSAGLVRRDPGGGLDEVEHAGPAVSLLPEAGGREREKGKSPALLAHFRDHLVDEIVILEAIPASESRLHQSPPERARAQRPERSQLGEDRSQRPVLLALKEKVVPQRQKNVDVGFQNELRE